MAATATADYAGTFSKTWTVESTADADTGVTITHGLGAEPEIVSLVPMTAEARISAWTMTSKSSTTIVLAKTTTMGSGASGAQLFVAATVLHSIVQ